MGVQPGSELFSQVGLLQQIEQAGLQAGGLDQSYRQAHGGGVLTADMDQIPTDHAIGIDHQIIEGLLGGRCARWSCDALGNVEDGHDLGVFPDELPQTTLLRSNALVSVEIQSDGTGVGLQGVLNGTAEHGIVDRPSVVADVPFVDPNDAHWAWLGGAGGSEADDSVVEQQIDRFADPGCGQSPQEQCCGSHDAALDQAIAESLLQAQNRLQWKLLSRAMLSAARGVCSRLAAVSSAVIAASSTPLRW